MTSSKPAALRQAPLTGIFLPVVVLVCLGLAASAVHSAMTLARLRKEYFDARGHDIAATIDAATRGPQRADPEVWRGVVQRVFERYSDSVAFITLEDAGGRRIVFEGEDRPDLHVFDTPLATRRRGWGPEPAAHGWRLRIGFFLQGGAFIMRAAHVQLAVSGLAILMLLGLAGYFVHTLRAYLDLQARETSQRQLAALGRMAATLAHEIRNPLGAMKGLTQVAQEELPQEHRARAHMSTVVREAERLERLVSDLLSFARPREARLDTLDLREVVEEVRDLMARELAEAAVQLEMDFAPDIPAVRADRDGLRQVLLNVLLNAVQASPRGAMVTLRARRGPERVVLEVEDRGPGLGGRRPDELFQPFASNRTRGTGLGLAVSRQIVERSAGTIDLADCPGAGARCTIVLPAAVPSPGSTGADSAATFRTEGPEHP